MTGSDKAHARNMAKAAPLTGRPRLAVRTRLGILPNDADKAIARNVDAPVALHPVR
jgi:hypothetical protein